jgi:hypothetical protein
MTDTVRTQLPEDDNVWVRRLALPEEYVIAHYPMARGSYWRWFESANIIDLMPIIRRRCVKQQPT